MNSLIRLKTVNLIRKLLKPLTEENLIGWNEYQEIIANLKNLAERNELLPIIEPKLLTNEEVAEMLSLSKTHFFKQIKDGSIKLPRIKIGTSIRYRNIDVHKLILSSELTDDVSILALE